MTDIVNERQINHGPVLRDWVEHLPWKMQSALLSSLRGPDAPTVFVKRVIMFMRLATQNDAGSGKYMPDHFPPLIGLRDADQFLQELAFLPVHYALHLTLGLQIVGIRHSDPEMRRHARDILGVIQEEWCMQLDDPSSRLA